jgi:methylglutaconyl-CoA hydratase
MQELLISTEDRICRITFNRPEKRNAISPILIAELKQALREAENNSEVKVVILTGAGNTFCSGADLSYLQTLQTNTAEENLQDSLSLKELYAQLYAFPKIIIGQINGHAIAGGCGIVSVCDFSFSHAEAHFGYTEVRIGFVPAIVMPFLINKIGESAARFLLLSGQIIPASEACRLGLINEVLETEKALGHFVDAFAKQIAEQTSGQSISATKALFREFQNSGFPDMLEIAAKKNAEIRSTADFKKGINAFLNKETIKW